MKEIKIFPTNVPEDLAELERAAHFTRDFSRRFHIDADDGILTPKICWPYVGKGVFEPFSLEAITGLETEVHLMVADPREIGRVFAQQGAHAIFGHVETFKGIADAKEVLESWRVAGAREVGMAVLYDTELDTIIEYAQLCDFMCLMSSAKIGAQGATFEAGVIDRVKKMHELFPSLELEVDIGVSETTIPILAQAGVTRFAVGSAIAKAPDPRVMHEKLLQLAEKNRG